MQVLLDLDDDGLSDEPVIAEVVEVLSYQDARLFAVVVPDLHGGLWSGLIHERSTALLNVL